jgi:ammonia channel protein AmtB
MYSTSCYKERLNFENTLCIIIINSIVYYSIIVHKIFDLIICKIY